MDALRLAALVLPLSLDTFAVAAALGLAGLSGRERARVAIVLPAVETALPLVGLALGAAAGSALGRAGDYAAAVALLGVGAWLLVEDEGEHARGARLARGGGLAVLALGLGVGLDELAIGFSAGLLSLPLVPALALIAVQAVVAAQLGLRAGRRLGEVAAARAGRLAGAALVVVGLAVLVVRLAG